MCNLYRMTKTVDEVAKLFAVEPDRGANFVAEVYPGYTGLVVESGRARAMTWGFPLVLTGRHGQKLKPKPVTNAREDKLHTAFWRDSFAHRRCLVPVSQWAEPEGESGQMTRTWYSLPDSEVMAIAALWRPSAEWGDCYSLVMVDSSRQMAEVHDRMPVLLRPGDQARWGQGSPDEAFALCRTWPGELVVERTRDRWVGGGTVPRQEPLL